MAATISLVILARNAEKTIRECLESAGPYVDEIIVGFGGASTDDTENIVRDWLIEWNKTKEQTGPELAGWCFSVPWNDDFAAARNEIWKKVTSEWALWLDADDILINGANIRPWIERHPEASGLWANYHYDEDEHGNLACTLIRERVIHHPEQWHWEGAVHEYLALQDGIPLVMATDPSIVVRHNPKRDKARGARNLDILYKELQRTEPDPPQRLLYYLGRENAQRGNVKEALLHWNRYISRSEWNEEAFQVAYLIADTLRSQGRHRQAGAAALEALHIAPQWPDAYLLLARIALEQGRFEEAVQWLSAASGKELPQTAMIVDPRTYTFWPHYYLGMALRGLGRYDEALDELHEAESVTPDPVVKQAIADIEQVRSGQKVLDAFHTLYEHLGRNDEWLKVRKLFSVAPKLIEQHESVREAHILTLAQTAHVNNPQLMVNFYRGNPSWVPFPEDKLFSESWRRHPRMAFVRKSITCPPPAAILDLGSSDGFLSLPLAAEGHIVDGFDLDPRCVDEANARADRHEVYTARYHEGSIEQVEGKYDAAIACEIIEHLVDPAAFLDQLDEHASKVILTTPYLAWENGNLPDWQKNELKGHLRIFDLADIEALLTGRGRIFDLYRQPFTTSSWIFASYRPRQQHEGTVTFLAPGTIEEWSPPKLREQGLGGSETALIRLAEELFLEGNQFCTVYGRIDSPGYYNGVRYRPWSSLQPSVSQDVVVAWRYPEAAELPLRARKLILWVHDTDFGDRLTVARAARFDKIIVLSEWHRQHMLECYPWLDEGKLVVIGNGVDLERFATVPDASQREPHRVAYTSSPDRGLDLVLEYIWPKVLAQVPDAELHVYYGMNNIAALKDSRPDLAEFYQRIQNLIADSRNVVQHGRIPQDRLAQELQRTAVWLYPSQSGKHPFMETYCISAVEAQKAGAVPVYAPRGALTETVAAGVPIEGMIGEPSVAERYAEAVVNLLLGGQEGLREQALTQAPAVDWSTIAQRWMMEVLGDEARS